MKTSENLVPSVSVNDNVNIFTTVFQIKHCRHNSQDIRRITAIDVFRAYDEIMIEALEARMRNCMDMLFRNRDRVIISNDQQVVFYKDNGNIHSFNIPSFKAMEEMVQYLKEDKLPEATKYYQGIRQLQKALYWIEKPKTDINNISFGNLISCLEELLLGECLFRE